MAMKVANTIVKQIIEKLALLTTEKNTGPKTTRFLFLKLFVHCFLVSVESTTNSSPHLENSLQFSYPFPESFVIMLIGIKFLLFLITSVSSSVLCHASGNSITTLSLCPVIVANGYYLIR